ncbi:MAG TPA: NAD-glutamate dehydrogenase [Oligoflexia bacterium]|nr:NAD-glutamate dehydrogenase [Oligoflexia bacterium]HMP49380.1 NAD-glutamate dehydrogenase [Oligoflexia bacterium]
MIKLTGVNPAEIQSPLIARICKLEGDFPDSERSSNKTAIMQVLAHGLFRKASSQYLFDTPELHLVSIVREAGNCLKNFIGSSSESYLSAFNPVTTPEEKRDNTGFFIILNDRPFIFDTIREYFNSKGLTPRCFSHPIFELDGNRLISFSYLELELPIGLTKETVISELTLRLGRLKHITNEFKNMFELTRESVQIIPSLESTSNDSTGQSFKPETAQLLEWIMNGSFIFLGATTSEKSFGILGNNQDILEPDYALLLNKYITEDINTLINSPDSFLVRKLPLKSPIHRPDYLDSIHFKIGSGKILSLAGLLTSKTLKQEINTIPVLASRLKNILKEEGLVPNSYDYKELVSLADTLPKVDFLQFSEKKLQTWFNEATQAQLQERTGLSHLVDQAGRFHYFTLIMPKERYSQDVLKAIEESILELCQHDKDSHDNENKIVSNKKNKPERTHQTGNSKDLLVETHAVLSDISLVLIRALIPISQGIKKELKADILDKLRNNIEVRTTSWDVQLRTLLRNLYDEDKAGKIFSYYSKALSEAYKANHSPEESICDIEMLERLTVEFPLEISLEEHPNFSEKSEYRLRIYKRGENLTLSGIVPFLENAGLEVISEIVSPVATEGAVWASIYDIFVTPKLAQKLNLDQASEILLPAVKKILQRKIDNDYLNHLLTKPGIVARDISMLRALVRYLVQIQVVTTPISAMEALVENANLSELLVKYFHTKFSTKIFAPVSSQDTNTSIPTDERKKELATLDSFIEENLKKVPSLAHDRYLRAMHNLLQSILRTNFFKNTEKERIALKIDCSKILKMPEPRPFMEIFVSAPDFQGVHLRGGKVARGGLRWSSRKDDFRTEVLGLMKTQKVKNSIIVPVGAKGGFVLHEEPTDRSELLSAVENTYKEFIRSLLEISDNRVHDKILRPQDCICYDEEDPYLVVAADKGTATFSNIANEIAINEFSFWLGDAFASGGSAGYDHKALGITARGAWECATRHFREIGVDVETQDFTVIGIGDMSGDVFGNGLLLSKHAKLIAAFDHRHIFIDPDPDPLRSFSERERLFSLPRSSWADYDLSLMSAGGMVISREEKSIQLNAECKKALGTEDDIVSANELIQIILTAPADLLWNGGIGTYVKASFETHLDASDRTNDEVRVNARDLRVRVVAEGGNLGFTQLARVEYARIGGHINTDAVDNSGGVDTSDLEVNLKLLFLKPIIDGKMTIEDRNKILKECEEEACIRVLGRNRSQSLAISLAAKRSRGYLHYYQDLISYLEKTAGLSRRGENLPDDETFEKRKISKAGLCRPELAVLLAYAKMLTFEEVLHSPFVKDPFLKQFLIRYFPKSIVDRFPELLDSHPLKDEIIATQIANVVIERMGPAYLYRLSTETSVTNLAVIKAFISADAIFGGRELVIHAAVLDRATTSRFYHTALTRIRGALSEMARWIITEESDNSNLNEIISKYQKPFQDLIAQTENILSPGELGRFQENIRDLLMHGVPKDLARTIAASQYATIYLDIVKVAEKMGKSASQIARLYEHLASELQVGNLIEICGGIGSDDKWEHLAAQTLAENLRQAVAKLCESILGYGNVSKKTDIIDTSLVNKYFTPRKELLDRYRLAISEINKQAPNFSVLFIMLSLLDKMAKP